MASVESNITEALFVAFSELTFNSGITVSWEPSFKTNTVTPGTLGLLTGDVVLANPRRMFIGSRKAHRRTGSLIITSQLRISSVTSDYARELSGNIAAEFPDDRKLTYDNVGVRVTEYPSVGEGYRDGAFWVTPVTIPFESFS